MIPGARAESASGSRGGDSAAAGQGGQQGQKGKAGQAEGPWQPQDAEQQREFMRQKLAQRQQAQVQTAHALLFVLQT